jgi:hypothetical protein
VLLFPCAPDAQGAESSNRLLRAVEWCDDVFQPAYRGSLIGDVEWLRVRPSLLDDIPAGEQPVSRALVTELRPDLTACVGDVLSLGLKPRLRYAHDRWDDGPRAGDVEDHTRAFINEGYAELGLFERQLFLGYARENLQWGPAFLTSPSNPFNSENGRDSPQAELPGLGYAKAVWKTSPDWSLNLLANTDRGRMKYPDYTPMFEQAYADAARQRDAAYAEVERQLPSCDLPIVRSIRRDAYAQIDAAYAEGVEQIAAREKELEIRFEPTWALKLDGVFERQNVSLIGSQREGDDPRLGGYAGWSATDATIVYGEAAAGAGRDRAALLGASYTFVDGTTLYAEYLFNQAGDPDAPLLDLLPPNRPYDPRRVFYRRNYFFLQAGRSIPFGNLSLVGRWTWGLDDDSHRLVGLVSRGLGGSWEAFVNGVFDLGGAEDEFGGTLSRQISAGVKAMF